MFNQEQLQLLNQELDSSRIKTRSKGNIQLSYLEGHDIINTANKIFGFGNWSYSVTSLDVVSHEVNQNQNNVVCYKAVVKVSVYNQEHTLNISREDVGFGTGIAKTLADSHEGGAKEAITDGVKRCMKSYGNQLGLSLYSKDKNHTNNAQYNNQPQQNYQQSPNNVNQQQYNPPQNQQAQTPYQHQQDFSSLTSLGLQVMQQGDSLIVVGKNQFENKTAIRNAGFFWNSESKVWFMPLNQAA